MVKDSVLKRSKPSTALRKRRSLTTGSLHQTRVAVVDALLTCAMSTVQMGHHPRDTDQLFFVAVRTRSMVIQDGRAHFAAPRFGMTLKLAWRILVPRSTQINKERSLQTRRRVSRRVCSRRHHSGPVRLLTDLIKTGPYGCLRNRKACADRGGGSGPGDKKSASPEETRERVPLMEERVSFPKIAAEM